jgi:hypothetical protein
MSRSFNPFVLMIVCSSMASKITDKLPWFLKEAVAATKGTTQYAAQHGMEGSPACQSSPRTEHSSLIECYVLCVGWWKTVKRAAQLGEVNYGNSADPFRHPLKSTTHSCD